jgi:hypothetical protein
MTFFKNVRVSINDTFLRINKRFRFVASVLALTGLMLLAIIFFFDSAVVFIPLLILASYFFTYFSILEGIEKREWLMLFIMPVLLTLSFYTFYFFFIPVRWITRVPFLFVYGLSFYAILLTSNIFNVGVERSLQLIRAAFAINYFYQTVILFLSLSVLFFFKQIFLVNGIGVFILVFLLSLQLLWSVKPKTYIDKKILNYCLLISLVMAEAAVVISFIPLQAPILSLFLTACYYSVAGLIYYYIDEKLFKPTIREYLFVIVFVGLIVLLSIQW